MKRTCIACPRGCLLEITRLDGGDIEVAGNQCSRGEDYGRQEMLEPMRMLTTTVRTADPGRPRLPVRLSREVPLRELSRFMEAVGRVTVKEDCSPGDILVRNLGGSDVDLLATGVFHAAR